MMIKKKKIVDKKIFILFLVFTSFAFLNLTWLTCEN